MPNPLPSKNRDDTLSEALFQSKQVPLVAPNLDFPYQVAMGGNIQDLRPMKVYYMAEKLARHFLSVAHLQYEQRKIQNHEEASVGAEMAGSMDPAMKKHGPKYLDENGQPRSKIPPYPWLIRIDEGDGISLYEKVLNECRDRKRKNPQWDWEDPDLHAEALDLSSGSSGRGPTPFIELSVPKPEWSERQLQEYLDAQAFPWKASDKKDVLLRNALTVHETRLRTARELGAKVSLT